MKGIRFLLIAIVVVAAAAVVAGCGGGSSSQDITSRWHGTVDGVETIPPDGDSGVPIDAWIEVYWPDPDFAPPSSFTFRLYKDTVDGWRTVKTIFKSQDSYPVAHPDEGIWWFAPENNMDRYTDYKIVVTDNYGYQATSYFTTGGGTGAASVSTSKAEKPKNYRPAGGGTPGGTAAEEHTIKTGR